MAKALVYGSMDPCSILAPFIDFLFFFLILWKFSKLEAGFGYITPLVSNIARHASPCARGAERGTERTFKRNGNQQY